LIALGFLNPAPRIGFFLVKGIETGEGTKHALCHFGWRAYSLIEVPPMAVLVKK
jgi:hypothetical protein